MGPSSTAAAPSIAPTPDSGLFPLLLLVQGEERRTIALEHTPFSIGRRPEKDLVMSDPRVSRDHAEITFQDGDYYIVDQGSKHGTWVNGERVVRHKLQRQDCIEIGARNGAQLIFQPAGQEQQNVAREFLSHISALAVPGAASDLEKLTLFLEAARKLNTTGAVEEILITLIDTTLRLTRAERGFVFLRGSDGRLRLAAGRAATGAPLLDDKTISHSILEEAANSASEFLVTDTMKSTKMAERQSIIAYDLRTVICIPLRKTRVQQCSQVNGGQASAPEVIGVLYLDSRMASGDMSTVSHDILAAIATEAAALVENANLVKAEEAARRYQQELTIAASIQQRLMAVTIPEVPFANLRARNLPCKDVGGDFYDVVANENALTVVVTDVSGKGISAALLAQILQGMIYAQILAGAPLDSIAAAANRFICQKILGEKYATLVVAQLTHTGEVRLVNCGHVPPLLISAGKVTRLAEGNVPVGLLADATFKPLSLKLDRGQRMVIVTDGVTEAENEQGEFFGDERLHAAACGNDPFHQIFASVRAFCADTPLNDDCTVLELEFKG